jgi:YD repeat-containing protein
MKWSIALLFSLLPLGIWAADFPQPVKWQPGPNAGTSVGLDAAGRVVAITLRDGRIVRSDYDANRRVTRQQTANGDIISYQRNAKGRLESSTERGVETRVVHSTRDGVVATVSGRTRGDIEKAARPLGIIGDTDETPEPVEYDGGGRASREHILNVEISYTYGSNGRDMTQALHTASASFAATRSVSADGAIHYCDTFGADYSLRQSAGRSMLVESTGRALAICDYDSEGRVLRMTIGALAVVYDYDGTSVEWTAKTVYGSGAVLRRFMRADYPDPELDEASRGERRAAAGVAVASFENGGLSFTTKSSFLETRVASPTLGLVYREFHFHSSTPYSDDLIRFLPDGSGMFLPSLPHAEGTSLHRAVRPFRAAIPAEWLTPKKSSLLRPVVTTTASKSITTARFRPVPLMMTMSYSCEWIPGGTVDYGGSSSVTAGRWDCGFTYGWAPHQEYYPPADNTGGSGTPADPLNTPMSTDQAQKVDAGKSLALDRVCNTAACAQLFGNLGGTGNDMINSTTYLDGQATQPCSDHPEWGAWTSVGGCQVYLCKAFVTTSASGAATLLIHEALHDSGMTENPPDPNALTSAQINALVQMSCDLTW